MNKMEEEQFFNYNIFGSTNSQEYDILFHVPEIPKHKDMNKIICLAIGEMIELHDKTKRVTLCIVKDGIITKTSDGLADEYNNNLFYTYSLHKQYTECLVNRPITRNIHAKLEKVVLDILSILEKTQYRQKILPLANATFEEKLKVFKELDLNNISFGFNQLDGEGYEDSHILFKQAASFELIQTIGLYDGIEIYTALDAYKHYDIPIWAETLDLNEIKNFLLEKKEQASAVQT